MTGPRRSDSLFPALYEELQRIANRRGEDSNSLEPQDLLHEAWLKLRDREWEGATHFRVVASMAMRQVVMDRVRRRHAVRRGEAPLQQTLNSLQVGGVQPDLLDVDRILSRLEEVDPRKALLAELKLFGGLTVPELAEAMGCSPTTVKNEWRTTRAWLLSQLA